FRKSFNHSWINNLSPEDPLNYERSTSKYSGGSHPGRPVYNGHFVRVRPTPLMNPKLVIYSEEMCKELGIGVGEVESESFLRYFSGDGGMEETPIETWATPYALSIMGRRYTNNCPFGTGDGYGDGRAISVGEVVVPFDTTSDPGPAYPHHAKRYELQLKGAGQTPFCRGADGRAVLRSSIREFLASEAMHHLGVCTTRALSLVVSDGANGDTSNRPWYSDNAKNRTPNLPQRCAITTRVASSFVRIGHLDLFARRVEMIAMKNAKAKNDKLEDMMWHACYREYYNDAYEPYWESKDAKSAAMALMNGTMNTLSRMVANWVRVGFVQGNFNADNCLVGGRTMDYGPFGFLDVYHPLSAKWTGSGEHFGFMNQPKAGYANFAVLVESLLPIIEANGGDADKVRDEMLKKAQTVFSEAVDNAMSSKMGIQVGPPEMAKEADELWEEIEPLLRGGRADWTLFWRQLTYVAAKYSPANEPSTDYDGMTLRGWIERWYKALASSHTFASSQSTDTSLAPPEERMRLANPKYTLREWMLVEAYSKADAGKFMPGDYSGVHELYNLTMDPYGEGSPEAHKKYYRRAPDESLSAGGTAFVS
ncbi:predicted protein, partial [Thalassiosira pseudonana CCMP1335]